MIRALNPSALCLVASATLLGHSIQEGNGFYNPNALNWMIAALAAAVLGVILHRFVTPWTTIGEIAMCVLLGGAIVWQMYELITSRPGIYILRGDINWFIAGSWVQAAAIALGMSRLRFARKVWFPLLLATSVFLGAWMIYASPHPYIDVVEVHKQAIDALMHGKNPYRIAMKNIYENDLAKVFYNPQAVFGDQLLIAYPYPPASLLLAIPGHLIFGDYRYSELLLLIAGAGLIGYARAGLVPKLVAALLLTTPRIWFVIEQGWTEPIAVFMLALTVFLLMRKSVPAAFSTGLLLVTKQYLGFGGLAAIRQVFMRPESWKRGAVAGVAGAAITVLPFLLWSRTAFMRNVVFLQTLEPFRADSLSFLSWAARHGYGEGSYLWAIGGAVIAAVISLILTRNTPGGFAAALSLTTFVMFAFGSKAFCNYYFFVIGALCCAVAAWPWTDEPEVVGATAARRVSANIT